jgi:hypothetical protein
MPPLISTTKQHQLAPASLRVWSSRPNRWGDAKPLTAPAQNKAPELLIKRGLVFSAVLF